MARYHEARRAFRTSRVVTAHKYFHINKFKQKYCTSNVFLNVAKKEKMLKFSFYVGADLAQMSSRGDELISA